MWRLYSREQDGIAVKSNFESLSKSFTCEQPVNIGSVQYVDYDATPIPFGNALLPLFYKRLSFSHEREVRAAVFCRRVQ